MMASATFSSTALAFEQKIGVIDMPTIFQNLPQREQVAKKIQGEFKERIEEIRAITKKQQGLVDKQKRDGALMTQQQKIDLVREMESLKSDYQLKSKALEEDGRRREAEERNKLLLTVEKAVNSIAKSEKYDLILQRNAVAYISKKHDISAKVIEKVSKSK
ncbi:molecular chaperone [Alteromonadales bacterium alter-6D02]|nr:molecular chaperone [Alteromonadales bacterium alter-6D02]